ncbi:hypothetical protein [uncultured Roseobacter sp.]|uniref:hypothetical protein n=1 Tax=uncultured Roseobacter sp. TaxID=114847 RepID=UPI002607A618|nr:hypothetical protein [uncultured Roseobacter sp.]
MAGFHISAAGRVAGLGVALTLGSCSVLEEIPLPELPELALPEFLRSTETTRIIGIAPAAGPCLAEDADDKEMAGSLLRRSATAGYDYDTVLLIGSSSTLGLAPRFSFIDRSAQVEDRPGDSTPGVGSRKADATERGGFGTTGALPNVYDVSYNIFDLAFSGPMVIGPGAAEVEIPSTGSVTFSGPIALELITPDTDGGVTVTKARGRFSLQAGYGSGRGAFAASGFDADLPFDRLTWTNLFQCGGRFVSSGKGVVSVQDGDGPLLPPFKTGRDAVPFRAVFESAQFAPEERPAPPVSAGGTFLIESDAGTLTGVFLSDLPPAAEDDAEAE